MFGQSLLSAFGSAVACTTDTDQLFTTNVQTTSTATYQLNSGGTSIPSNTYPLTTNGITFASGKFGNAAGFSSGNASTGDYMKVSNSIYGSSTTVFSWSLWIKCNNTTGTGINIMGNGALAGGQTGYTVYLYNGRLALSTLQSGDQYFPNPESNGTLINDNQWHNIVFTYNNGAFVLYLDGSPNQTGTSSNYINNATPASDTYIGNSFQRGISDGIVNGQIDQVRVFGGTILNQNAVTALYNETTTTATYPYITTEVANPNSVAYYKMSNATDQLGNYNGTPTNVNFNTEGKFGFAGVFNGSSSYIQIPNNSFNYTTMSFSAWVNPSANNRGYIFQNGLYDNRIPGSIGWYVRREPNGSVLARGFSANSLSVGEFDVTSASGLIPINTWTNVVCVLTPTSFNIYLNGSSTAVASATFSNPITYSASQPANVYIGATYYYYNGAAIQDYWQGKIDQIRIYDAALSAANLTTLYNEVECEPAAINALANFNTVLYAGNNSTQPITTVGFQPNFTWIKARDYGSNNHALTDSVRGTGSGNGLSSNTPGAEGQYSAAYGYLSAFGIDGFTVQTGSTSPNFVNSSSANYVAWNWKAGGTAVSNTDGTITSQVSANTDAGFSVVSYTGNLQAGASIGHSLGVKPDLIITKSTSNAESWEVWSSAFNNGGVGQQLRLNSFNAAFSAADYYSTPDTSKFYVGGYTGTNGNGYTYVSYCFTSIPGYSNVGSYTSTYPNTTSVYVGFQPRFVMIKSYNQARNWVIHDSARGADEQLYANLSNAEYNTGTDFQFTSTGFNVSGGGNDLDGGSSYSYIFLAIA